MQVCWTISRISSASDGTNLHTSDRHNTTGAVLPTVSSVHLLLLDALCNLLHHLQLLWVGQVPWSRAVAKDVSPDVDKSITI